MREPQHSQGVGLGKVTLANYIWWSINFDEESHEWLNMKPHQISLDTCLQLYWNLHRSGLQVSLLTDGANAVNG